MSVKYSMYSQNSTRIASKSAIADLNESTEFFDRSMTSLSADAEAIKKIRKAYGPAIGIESESVSGDEVYRRGVEYSLQSVKRRGFRSRQTDSGRTERKKEEKVEPLVGTSS